MPLDKPKAPHRYPGWMGEAVGKPHHDQEFDTCTEAVRELRRFHAFCKALRAEHFHPLRSIAREHRYYGTVYVTTVCDQQVAVLTIHRKLDLTADVLVGLDNLLTGG